MRRRAARVRETRLKKRVSNFIVFVMSVGGIDQTPGQRASMSESLCIFLDDTAMDQLPAHLDSKTKSSEIIPRSKYPERGMLFRAVLAILALLHDDVKFTSRRQLIGGITALGSVTLQTYTKLEIDGTLLQHCNMGMMVVVGNITSSRGKMRRKWASSHVFKPTLCVVWFAGDLVL